MFLFRRKNYLPNVKVFLSNSFSSQSFQESIKTNLLKHNLPLSTVSYFVIRIFLRHSIQIRIQKNKSAYVFHCFAKIIQRNKKYIQKEIFTERASKYFFIIGTGKRIKYWKRFHGIILPMLFWADYESKSRVEIANRFTGVSVSIVTRGEACGDRTWPFVASIYGQISCNFTANGYFNLHNHLQFIYDAIQSV